MHQKSLGTTDLGSEPETELALK